MRAIIARLQQYELIKPVTGFTPLGPISHIEVQPVKQYETYCEPCVLGEEDFWSVYVRYDPAKNKQQFGGVDCIADCSDADAASNLADLIARLLGIPVVGL